MEDGFYVVQQTALDGDGNVVGQVQTDTRQIPANATPLAMKAWLDDNVAAFEPIIAAETNGRPYSWGNPVIVFIKP